MFLDKLRSGLLGRVGLEFASVAVQNNVDRFGIEIKRHFLLN